MKRVKLITAVIISGLMLIAIPSQAKFSNTKKTTNPQSDVVVLDVDQSNNYGKKRTRVRI